MAQQDVILVSDDSERFLTAQEAIKNNFDELYAAIATGIFLRAYPVGCIYESVNSTNPANLFGGTWVAFGTGQVTVGIDAGQTEFDTVEETGGTKTHTLTESEMPSHTHVQNAHTHEITDPGHTHGVEGAADLDTGVGSHNAGNGAGTQSGSSTTGITINNQTPTNQNTGGGQAHNNLQPYIVVYRFKRTA